MGAKVNRGPTRLALLTDKPDVTYLLFDERPVELELAQAAAGPDEAA
jgi:hypothetical protein